MIPLTRPVTGVEEEAAVAEVLRSGWLTQGPAVTAFEDAVARFVGVRHAVAANSCTSALFVALEVLGVKPGDEVIVPAFTFIATANVVRQVGATPVFADIDLSTFNLDPARAEAVRTPRTKVVMPVDQVGFPCDLDAFLAWTRSAGVRVLQDAACALGSVYKDEPVGRRADLACFSFHPRKVVTCGEGGMIVTADAGMAARARCLISHGATVDEMEKHRAVQALEVRYPVVGYNYRLSSLQGAVGEVQVGRLPGIVETRRALAAAYRERLAGEERVVLPPERPWAAPNYQSFLVRLAKADRGRRDEVVQRMRVAGVQVTPGIPAIHRQEAYRGLVGDLRLPATERASDTTLFLPLFPGLETSELDRVVEVLRAALDG